jgi:hypothetical protein
MALGPEDRLCRVACDPVRQSVAVALQVSLLCLLAESLAAHCGAYASAGILEIEMHQTQDGGYP